MAKGYDPRNDPIVKKSLRTKNQAERDRIERPAITPTDNGPKISDLPALAEVLKSKKGKK